MAKLDAKQIAEEGQNLPPGWSLMGPSGLRVYLFFDPEFMDRADLLNVGLREDAADKILETLAAVKANIDRAG